MITLETTITHTEKRTLKVNTPAFWKNPTSVYDEYIAVLDEKTFIKILTLWSGESLMIDHGTVERNTGNILKAQSDWNIITEQEFMQVYDDAWESMRLQPKMFSIGEEKEEAIKQAVSL